MKSSPLLNGVIRMTTTGIVVKESQCGEFLPSVISSRRHISWKYPHGQMEYLASLGAAIHLQEVEFDLHRHTAASTATATTSSMHVSPEGVA